MSSQNNKENNTPPENDDFWDLSGYGINKKSKETYDKDKIRPPITAVDLNISLKNSDSNKEDEYKDSKFTFDTKSNNSIDNASVKPRSNLKNEEKSDAEGIITVYSHKTDTASDSYGAARTEKILSGKSDDQNMSEEIFSDVHSSDTPFSKNHDREDSDPEHIIKKYIPPHKPSGKNSILPIIEYTPDNALIKQIRIFPSSDGTVINRNILFSRERESLLHAKGTPCEPVGYFSFSPRYSQLTKSQLSWYLWWRENMRNGNYIQTDYSYVKLYIMELLTADESEDIDGCLDKLCRLYINNHDSVLGFMYLGRLISDFCMLHRLSSPSNLLAPYMHNLIFHHVNDEFYLGPSKANRDIFPEIAIKYISVYNYRKSKFAVDENRKLYDKHIFNAVKEVFQNDECYDLVRSKATGAYSTVVTERKVFDGQRELVSKDAKIQTIAYPISCIQGTVTDTIRYAENKIRDHLGVRSKLSILSLDKSIKCVIDAYFDKALPKKAQDAKLREQKKSPRTEYDRFYDLPKTALSIENASQIEKNSWNTTKILIETFGGDGQNADPDAKTNTPLSPDKSTDIDKSEDNKNDTLESSQTMPGSNHDKSEKTQKTGEANEYDDLINSLGNLAGFISLCKNRSFREQRQFASEQGLSCDEIADIINENAANILGDIILEEDSGGYGIISDYLSIIKD